MLLKNKYWIVVVTFLMSTIGCNQDYLERYPLSGPSAASFYSNPEELMLGLYGCYSGLNFTTKPLRPWIIILDVTTDVDWNRNDHPLQEIGKGAHASDNAAIVTTWQEFYKTIGRCNFLLDNIDKVQDQMSEELFNQVKSEARFVRALSYHYLIELYGGVPLVTKTLSLEESQMARNSKDEVADFVIREMDEIVSHLPTNYPGNTGRATKGAALAIKARTALYNGHWEVAAGAAKAVMDLNHHGLHPDFAELFTYDAQNSNEVIFALQYQKGVIAHMNSNVFASRLALGVSNEVPPQSLVDSYECIDGLTIDKSPLFDLQKPFQNRDPRLDMTIVLPGTIFYGYQFETHPDSLLVWNYNTNPASRVGNTDATNAFATYTGYLFRKYTDIRDMADDENCEMNIMLIRYAEVLLTYAEAKIEANQIDESVYQAINTVRQRPGVDMPAITAGKTQSELRSIVRRERKCELALEGLRLFDIRRWGIAEQVMHGPLLGRIPRELLSNAPVIDENGTPDYSNVINRNQMRVIETRIFNPARDYLWPIPNIEILTNGALVQNPNY